MDDTQHILVVLGPTASGKTELACRLAKEIDAEIISADSRQIYRYMDIGTGKDLEEYEVDGIKIPYHLIDVKDPGYKYNIAEFQLDFIEVLKDLKSRGKKAILCGGSGLYIESALKGNSYLGIPMNELRREELFELDDESLTQLYEGISDKVKQDLSADTRGRKVRAIIVDEYLKDHPDFKAIELPEFKYTIVGVDIDRDLRREKIDNRLKYRIDHGLIEEAEWLLANYLSHDDMEYYGLEYKWLGQFLKNEIGKNEMYQGLRNAIFKFAKRQMTWFRRMERNGYQINWVSADQSMDEKVAEVLKFYPE